jgi:hypothetical protein
MQTTEVQNIRCRISQAQDALNRLATELTTLAVLTTEEADDAAIAEQIQVITKAKTQLSWPLNDLVDVFNKRWTALPVTRRKDQSLADRLVFLRREAQRFADESGRPVTIWSGGSEEQRKAGNWLLSSDPRLDALCVISGFETGTGVGGDYWIFQATVAPKG